MALKARIESDLKEALLAGDKFRAQVLRGLKASILNEEVAAGKREEGLDDTTIEQVIVREVKKRNESAELYEQNDRPESAADERKEVEILSIYLPEQLSEEKIKEIINETVVQLGAGGPGDMGKVIGAVKAKVGTSAEGSVIAKLVKEALLAI